jgi:hypothetical protein
MFFHPLKKDKKTPLYLQQSDQRLSFDHLYRFKKVIFGRSE